MTAIKQAYELSQKLHAGQTDRAGKAYFSHIKRVFKTVGGFNAKNKNIAITALLHDSVEDTNITVSKIESMFGKEVAAAVDAISKRKGEKYSSYLRRVKSNKISRIVKIADLMDNMDMSRLKSPTEKDYARLEKYKAAVKYLK